LQKTSSILRTQFCSSEKELVAIPISPHAVSGLHDLLQDFFF
jgi:hypothetical protein